MKDSESDTVLRHLPDELNLKLIEEFNSIRRNYAERRWAPSELSGAKLCEIVYRILEWHTSDDGTYTPFGEHIGGFESSVRKFRNRSSFPAPVRFHIPNALAYLYRVRNDRGVGHIGGDVDPNHMDAKAVVGMANWVVAELVRIFHEVSVEEATATVDSIVETKLPLVWEVVGTKRVLDPEVTYRDAALILLYNPYPEPLDARDLCEWVGGPRFTDFKRRVLHPSHKKRLIEYDDNRELVFLSPLGVEKVEGLLATEGYRI